MIGVMTMQKNDAENLKKGDVVYYLTISYLVEPCTVENVTKDETGNVVVSFDDGCEEVFTNDSHKYIYLTRKEAIDAARYELEGMLEAINQTYPDLDKKD